MAATDKTVMRERIATYTKYDHAFLAMIWHAPVI